ncbi:hypothetical protein V6N13_020705 [Hibiscus sabdariffa]
MNKMGIPLLFLATFLLLLSTVHPKVIQEQLSKVKLNSRILQDSVVKTVNENPQAGWKAALNPRFSNYTVGEFKHILGVKPTPKKELLGVPVVTHVKSLKLPANFDARTAWPQCSTIGRILGELLLSSVKIEKED